jgi:hypothetical protein
MKLRMALSALTLALAIPAAAMAGSGKSPPGQLENNLGDLTKEAIENGFDQGGHSADPSSDGLGREDRSGLANIFDQGDLGDTIEFLDQ